MSLRSNVDTLKLQTQGIVYSVELEDNVGRSAVYRCIAKLDVDGTYSAHAYWGKQGAKLAHKVLGSNLTRGQAVFQAIDKRDSQLQKSGRNYVLTKETDNEPNYKAAEKADSQRSQSPAKPLSQPKPNVATQPFKPVQCASQSLIF